MTIERILRGRTIKVAEARPMTKMNSTKLVSAFEMHSKRRRSTEIMPPLEKSKRKRSSVSEGSSFSITKTGPKLNLAAHVNLQDIAKSPKKTPRKSINGKASPSQHNRETPKKRGKKKKPRSDSESSGFTLELTPNQKGTRDETSETPEKTPGKPTPSKPTPSKPTPSKPKNASQDQKEETTRKTQTSSPKASQRGEIINDINPPEEAETLFSWVIHPISIRDFFKKNWEKAPLHIKRNRPYYYKLLMSTPQIDEILRSYHIAFGKNLDLTTYSNNKRETHNPEGRALPSVVWDYYANGCSVRMLNPQTFIPKLHNLNASLQEFFGCLVGANFYLTPPGTQGFAPHYDDIEAFVLQIEGRKRWRLYKPRNSSEFLPRVSSKNFDPSEIGEPLLDVILEPGDVLYFPRGTIHQGHTLEGTHSLHVTLSVYQKNCWADFLEKLVPDALQTAINQDPEFREGMPIGYTNFVGVAHAQKDSIMREKVMKKTKELLLKMIENIDIDKAADEMAKGHIHDFLPPVLAPTELDCSVFEDGERMGENGRVMNRVEIEPDTRVRLARGHAVRLVKEEDAWKVYYSADNTKEYHELEVQSLEVGQELVKGLKQLIEAYPEFVTVDDLDIEGEDNRVQVVRDLWEKCIVLTDTPLPIID